jgi:hypothetical protein
MKRRAPRLPGRARLPTPPLFPPCYVGPAVRAGDGVWRLVAGGRSLEGSVVAATAKKLGFTHCLAQIPKLVRDRARACARARNPENSRSAATLAGTEQLRKDRALFSALMANRSRTSRSTSTIPPISEFGFSRTFSRFRPVARRLLRRSVALQKPADRTPALVSGPGALVLLRRMQPRLGMIDVALNAA